MGRRGKRQSQPIAYAGSSFGVGRPAATVNRGPWLTRAAFGIAVVVVIARLFMAESLRPVMQVLPGADAVPLGPGPSAGLLLDLLAGLCPILVLLRRRIDPSFTLRAEWSALLLVALAAWAVISTAWASDRFAAAISSAHLLAAAGMAWAVLQAWRTPAYTRLTAALSAGLLVVLLAHGLWHQFVERNELRALWEKDSAALLAGRNIEPGSFEAIQFENKILRGELMGFNASPNTYAAQLVMLGLITLATAIELARGGRWVAAGAMLVLLLTTSALLPLTQSRTGFLTAMLGIVLLAVAIPLRGWIGRRPVFVYLLGAVAVLAVFAFVIGYGVSRGTLFHDSLEFRWRYWTGAFDVWQNHPLLGTGWENFGPSYLAVRIPEATEEIKDPHNYLVRFAAELGLVGLLLAIAWTAVLWWRITRPTGSSAEPEPSDAAAVDRPTLPLQWLGGLAAAMAAGFVLNYTSAIDFSQDDSYLLLEAFRNCVYLFLALLLATVVCVRLVRDGREPKLVVDAAEAPMIRLGIVVALGMFFVHNLIDFAMFEVGPMFLMALLMGVAIAEGTTRSTTSVAEDASGEAEKASAAPQTKPTRVPRTPRIALAVVGAVWLIGVIVLVIPTISAESIAAEADAALRANRPAVAATAYESAFQKTVANGDYAMRSAIAWRLAADPGRAKLMFDRAIAARPLDAGYYVARAELARSVRPSADQAAADDYATAVKLDPMNARNRIEYAAVLEKLGQPANAAEQLRAVLANESRLKAEEKKRLPAAVVEEIRKKIETLGR